MKSEKEIQKKLNKLYLEQEILLTKTNSVKIKEECKRMDKVSEVARAQRELKELNKVIKILEWVLKKE